MHTSEDYWLSRTEVAARLKIPTKTLAEWACHKKGPKFAKIGRFTRYRLADLEAWENEQFTGAA
ncbi:helix-turn-helix domain-containing protein [Nocardia farcinica]|uniref:helix-turn-helix transcriptional regulator n=1 Tax=Nocardia farcinica TaxID=37329 RepID=UPI0018952B49|nr:helix-turn-helix domain-containing protein [Nocardia farcinica]MBF6422689.1 helix-turn-helix domain-containing protein [Nocardia farcinica]MBF6434368.1 helix-turn-helix domain-containing protein [Nocardia farcinica]MBF6505453.1 helix-turn-helix domain-containing protein [Nocardia farcinica]